VAENLREEGYSAKICLNSPEIKTVSEKDSSDVYNLESSLDCIDQADACVFIFMSSNKWKFFDYSPFYPDLPPQEFNSSVVIEFDRWKQGVSRNEAGLIIYENDMEEQLGSLVRGVTKSGNLYSESIETHSYGHAITQITDTIAGRGRNWADLFEKRLLDRMSK
jgi:hypothetical protein